MPQTAFTANGAGVKSSVMFLKKYSENDKQSRKSVKTELQSSLIEDSEDGIELFRLLEDKKKELAKYTKLMKEAEKYDSDKFEELKEQRQQISDDFDEKIEKIREILTENYDEKYKKELGNYSIFMAIAEEIGYDAAGKETGINELENISKELSRFINAIEEGNDRFFL